MVQMEEKVGDSVQQNQLQPIIFLGASMQRVQMDHFVLVLKIQQGACFGNMEDLS